MYKTRSIRFFATEEDHQSLAAQVASKFPNVLFEEEDNRNPHAVSQRILSPIKSSNYSDIEANYLSTSKISFESSSYLRIHKPHPARNHKGDINLRDDVIERMAILGSTTIDLVAYEDDAFKAFQNYIFSIIRKSSHKIAVINPNTDEFINMNPPGSYCLNKAFEWSRENGNYLMNSSIQLYYKPLNFIVN